MKPVGVTKTWKTGKSIVMTIPKLVRDLCDIHNGDLLIVYVQNKRVILEKLEKGDF